MKAITIGKFNIEIKDALSWYDRQELEAVTLGGAKMAMEHGAPTMTGINGDILLKTKIKLFELAILKITEGEKEIPFSIDWLKTLSQSEGEQLDSAIDTLDKAEKKN